MYRDHDSLYLDDLCEFYRDREHAYFACRRVNANAELVCDGLAIDDGGNTPHDECNQIVSAACRAFENMLGFGATKCVSFYQHAQAINGETTLAVADLDRDEDKFGDEEVVGTMRWIERDKLPAAAEELLAKADEAFDSAYFDAVAEVEAQHNRDANEWIEQLIADNNIDGLRDALDNPVSCASDEVIAKAQAVVDAADAAEEAKD